MGIRDGSWDDARRGADRLADIVVPAIPTPSRRITPLPEPDQTTPIETRLAPVEGLLRAGRVAEAAAVVESVGADHPNHHDVDLWRLRIAATRQDPLGVLRAADRLLEHRPGNPQLVFNRIQSLYALGRLDDAVEAIDRALPGATPQERHNLNGLRFKSLLRHGDAERLRSILSDLAAVEGDTPRIAELEIDLLEREGELDRAIERAETILARGGLPDQVRITTGLHLARLLDRRGRFEEAFESARRANDGVARAFDPRRYAEETDAQIEFLTADRMRSLPRSTTTDERPVFIVGMPRSGTSLLEQIIASHPRGYGLGERQHPRILSEDLRTELGGGLPAVLADASTDLLDTYANRYLRTFEDLGAADGRVVNKSLGLDRLVGFLGVLLPNARFLWIHRDPADNILSTYLHFVAQPWAWNLDDLIVARRCHDRLRTHWTTIDPDRHLAIAYEHLTSRPADETGRVLDFLGLPRDERTLDFHTSGRAVMTPSAAQVNEPMNRNAIERWRNYARELRTVLDAFGTEDRTAPRP